MGAYPPEAVDRWLASAVEEGPGLVALVAMLAGADEGEHEATRALLAAAGRRLAAGLPLPLLLGQWLGRRLERVGAGEAPGRALGLALRRGQKARTQKQLERVGRMLHRYEELRAAGVPQEEARARVGEEFGISADRVPKVLAEATRGGLRPVKLTF